MLWTPEFSYEQEPFETEADLEEAILVVAPILFGEDRIYLDAKRKIGLKGRVRNVPDGYLLDLSSSREPKLYVVENELSTHESIKHIAVQILEFSLSFESSPKAVKDIIKNALTLDIDAMLRCHEFASKHGFENVDYLLERMVFGPGQFNALVVIDELDQELETVLISRFKFPVEVLTLERYVGPSGQRVFRFEPFLADVGGSPTGTGRGATKIDPAEVDTIVVPARAEGFADVFIGENRWYSIRIHAGMIPKIRYIAAYRVKPESSITHVAPVASIEQWPGTNKYVVTFGEPATPVGPIPLASKGRVKAPQAPRYTSMDRLKNAQTLDDVF